VFLEIEHRLSFRYDVFIRESFLELRMQPKTTSHQTLSSFMLAVGPPTKVSRYRDWNGNVVHHFTVANFHDRIEVNARSLVNTESVTATLATVTDRAPFPPPAYPLLDFLEFGRPVRKSAALRAFSAAASIPAGAALGEQVAALGRHIREHFTYQRTSPAMIRPPMTSWNWGRGSARTSPT